MKKFVHCHCSPVPIIKGPFHTNILDSTRLVAVWCQSWLYSLLRLLIICLLVLTCAPCFPEPFSVTDHCQNTTDGSAVSPWTAPTRNADFVDSSMGPWPKFHRNYSNPKECSKTMFVWQSQQRPSLLPELADKARHRHSSFPLFISLLISLDWNCLSWLISQD